MMLDTPKKVLLAMAQVFSDHPALFTQKWFARNSGGERVSSSSNDAVCFCILGFLNRLPLEGAATEETCAKAMSLMEESTQALYAQSSLSKVNDNLGREAIIQLALDAAAKIKN